MIPSESSLVSESLKSNNIWLCIKGILSDKTSFSPVKRSDLIVSVSERLIRFANSFTGFEVSKQCPFSSINDNSRGIVVALRQTVVGTTAAYFQLLIHPMKILLPSVPGIFDQVTPGTDGRRIFIGW